MRGRLVLLDDEDAGADAADRELLVPLDLCRLGRHRLDSRAARPLFEKGDELIDGRRRSLGVDPHRPVIFVAHPAEGAEAARPPLRRVAEADALDAAADHDSNRLRFAAHRR